MVLQRKPSSATVWGFDALLPDIESSLDCIAGNGEPMPLLKPTPTRTDENVWQLKLPPMAAGTVCDIKIHDSIEAVELKKVSFGDIWLCSGQSNMHFMMKDIVN